MPKEIYLLKVGMTMTEGLVSEWYITDGDQVKKGDMLYALETCLLYTSDAADE